MAKWTGVVTNLGNSLLGGLVNEKTLNFDSAWSGTGTVAIAAIMAQTDLVDKKQAVSIIGAEEVDGGVRLQLRIPAAKEGYLLNQIGVWASVDGGEPVMIAMYQNDDGIPIPSMDDSPDFIYTFFGLVMASNVGTWTVNVDTSAIVSRGEMEAYLTDELEKRTYGAIRRAQETADQAQETADQALAAVEAARAEAKAYTDAAMVEAKTYTDAAMAEAGAYTDTAKAEAKAYTDTAKAEAKSYTDSKRITKTATITTTWSGSGPYTQTVTVSGILATDMPHITPVYSTTNATAIAQKEAWNCVSKAVTAADKLTFTCFEDKPTTAIPIQIEVIR